MLPRAWHFPVNVVQFEKGGVSVGKYDNYDNRNRIKAASKKLEKLQRKRKPDLFAVDLARKELENEQLFSSCQIFGVAGGLTRSEDNPNDNVLFSDDNRVMMFWDKLIRYEDIQSYRIVGNAVQRSYTTTKRTGGISRAIIGGAIAGGVGAVVGASTAGAKSQTTYYKSEEGFLFQIFLKDGSGYQHPVPSSGLISNKLPAKWKQLADKLQEILNDNDK